jgi:hypothetical protein
MKKILIFNYNTNIKNKNKTIDDNIPININNNDKYNNIRYMYEYKLNNIYKYNDKTDLHMVYSVTDINNIKLFDNCINN